MKSKFALRVLAIIGIALMLLTGCTKQGTQADNNAEAESPINSEALLSIFGEYDISEKSAKKYGNEWALAIYNNSEVQRNIFSIYDRVGNPGLYGEIIFCSETELKIEIDYDYFEKLPTESWIIEDDKYVNLKYSASENGIALTNNKVTIEFTATAEV